MLPWWIIHYVGKRRSLEEVGGGEGKGKGEWILGSTVALGGLSLESVHQKQDFSGGGGGVGGGTR